MKYLLIIFCISISSLNVFSKTNFDNITIAQDSLGNDDYEIPTINFYELIPSAYSTYGSYSNSMSTKSYSVFSNFNLNYKYQFTIGFDNLSINNKDWNYSQNFYVGSSFLIFDPLYFKFSFGYIIGDYNSKPAFIKYSDNTSIISGEITYRYDILYFGVGLSHINFISRQGKDSINNDRLKQFNLNPFNSYSDQLDLRFEYLFSPTSKISLKPSLIKTDSNKTYFSSKLKFSYSPFENFLLTTDLSYGDRLYYFDNDLLTIYNQYEIQNYTASIKLEYNLLKYLTGIFSYQHTKFNSYSINYYILGLKYLIKF